MKEINSGILAPLLLYSFAGYETMGGIKQGKQIIIILRKIRENNCIFKILFFHSKRSCTTVWEDENAHYPLKISFSFS